MRLLVRASCIVSVSVTAHELETRLRHRTQHRHMVSLAGAYVQGRVRDRWLEVSDGDLAGCFVLIQYEDGEPILDQRASAG